MLKLNNMKMGKKLTLILLPALIAIIIVSVFSSQKIVYISQILTKNVYNDSYKSVSLILNADRDMYQALTSQINLQNKTNITENVAFYNENIKQAEDRVKQAKEIVIKNNELFESIKHKTSKKNMKELFEIFDKDYKNWLSSFDVSSNTVNDSTASTTAFDSARESLNEIGEILDKFAEDANTSSEKTTQNTIIIVIITTIISLVISFLIGITIISNINKRTSALVSLIKKISDLDLKYNEKTFGNINLGDDEFGLLTRHINDTIKSLDTIVRDIKSEAEVVYQTASVSKSKIEKLKSNLDNISASTEELSASMEETAAATQEVNSFTEEISTWAENINQKSIEAKSESSELIMKNKELSSLSASANSNLKILIKEYLDISVYFDKFTDDLRKDSTIMFESIKSTVKGLSEVSTSNTHSAFEITEIAKNATNILKESNDVLEYAEKSRKCSFGLMGSINKFSINS